MTQSFAFASPAWLLLLLLLPLLSWYVRRLQRRRGAITLRFSDVQPALSAHASWRMRLRPLLSLARILCLAAIIVALARPQWVLAREVVHGQGVDIVLALDISGSMASLDFEPDNRLATARHVIDEFIERRPYDRLGLVVFARNAYNQSPPTTDHRILRRLLGDVKLAPEMGLDDGTAIGMGLANAANMLRDSTAKSKVVILATDGVNNAGQINPITAAAAAKALGIKVYTIGMGKQGMVPVPIPDLFGNPTVTMQESAIDEGMLLSIADATGGRFFRAEDADALRQIYEEIDTLEKSDFEVETFTDAKELAGLAMVPALLLLLVEVLLRSTWMRTLP